MNNRPVAARRLADFVERIPSSPGAYLALLGLLAVIFALGNFPWHLDEYDQAKQAYVAFEIEKTGELLYQTTPQGRSASKPPLMGWISAAAHAVGLPWALAHRLPSLACAIALLVISIGTGRALLVRPARSSLRRPSVSIS